MATVPTKSYKAIAAVARRRRDAVLASFYDVRSIDLTSISNDLTTFPQQSGYLSTEEMNIVESTANEILHKVAERTWSSLDVAKAFCKSASIAQRLASFSIHQSR